MQPLPQDHITKEIARLQRPLGGRRWLSWLLALVTLAFCLVIPLAASLYPSLFGESGKTSGQLSVVGALKGRAAPTAHALDNRWNPGKLAASHAPWAQDCKVCHSTPFARVKDDDCKACHKDAGEHVEDGALIAGMPALHETRCATCHRDHQGQFGLVEQNKRYTGSSCASCHADLKSKVPDTSIADVGDFADKHPPFRIQIAQEGGRLQRIRQKDKINGMEVTGLKFPHDLHLAKKGIAGPKGKEVLECASCHKPGADNIGFQIVSMKENCQSCHSLAFEPAVPNRQVPHGSSEEALSTLREFYGYVGSSKVALDAPASIGPVPVARPGVEGKAAASFIRGPGDARQRAAAAATELFERTACTVCHTVTRVKGPGKAGTPGADLPQYSIEPVAPRHAWFRKSVFNHASHRNTSCTDCHAAPKSSKASEVLIPAIDTCRSCHVGVTPQTGKIASDCGLCHSFHLPSPAAPEARP